MPSEDNADNFALTAAISPASPLLQDRERSGRELQARKEYPSRHTRSVIAGFSFIIFTTSELGRRPCDRGARRRSPRAGGHRRFASAPARPLQISPVLDTPSPCGDCRTNRALDPAPQPGQPTEAPDRSDQLAKEPQRKFEIPQAECAGPVQRRPSPQLVLVVVANATSV